MSQSRQLAAIMFTDIVGYTVVMGEDEKKAFELLKKNRLIQRPIIEKYNGRWLKELGDGVLASFSTVTDAIYAAGTIQKACENEPELNVRIGIHLGEVVFEGDDVFGDGVNIASRLEALAPVGGILVSESVNRDLGNKKGIETHFVREETLKNVKNPIKVYEVTVEGIEAPEPAPSDTVSEESKPVSRMKLGLISLAVIMVFVLAYVFYFQTGGEETQPAQLEVIDKSIAVLPFVNDSSDPENEYFCNGMMDEILSHLQKIAALGVKSRTAVEPYRDSDLGFAAIAEELKVAYVLEGAVRKYGDRFRVTTQLIEVKSGNHLWAESYDGIFSDTIFVVQTHIAKKIASSLNAVITPAEEESIDKVPTTDVAAYDLRIKANQELWSYYHRTHDQNQLIVAHKLLDIALQIDSEYLDAVVAKGSVFMAERNFDSAFVYADRAMALDPESSQAYRLKGDGYYAMGRSDLAIENLQKAIDLSPSLDWSTGALINAYLDENDVIKALRYLQPKPGLAKGHLLWGLRRLGTCFKIIGDYERSGDFFAMSAEISSESLGVRFGCNNILENPGLVLVQGNFQEAHQFADSVCQLEVCQRECSRVLFQISFLLEEFQKAEQYFFQWQNAGADFPLFEVFVNIEMGYVYHQLGKIAEAKKMFSEQIQKLRSDLDNPRSTRRAYLNLARIYAFQGDTEKSLNYLAKYAKRGFTDGWHDFILIDPLFKSLRDDPEFQEIVKQAQEEKAALRVQVREMEERGELNFELPIAN